VTTRRPAARRGAATEKFRTSRPIGDHSTIGIEKSAATKKRLRMSVTIDAIDMSSCASWPPAIAA
jgi:hypothetical protein